MCVFVQETAEEFEKKLESNNKVEDGRLTDRMKKRKFDRMWHSLPEVVKDAWEKASQTCHVSAKPLAIAKHTLAKDTDNPIC